MKRLEIIGPFIDLDQLTRTIEVEIVDRIGSSWDEWFGMLRRFKAHSGHCNVPITYREGTFCWGGGSATQRANHNTMSTEHRQRFDLIGFVWDVLETFWEEKEGFAALRQFKAREGHCDVPQRHVEGTFRLWQWIGRQRSNKDKISAEHRQRLDAIGFVWRSLESSWEEGFAALTAFKAREGHCLVCTGHVEGTFNLGTWVSHQRANRNTMSTERRQRLNEIGFICRSKEPAAKGPMPKTDCRRYC